MSQTELPARPQVLAGERPEVDHRITAVLDVLAGEPAGRVAARHDVDVALLRRWVNGFIAGGTAQVTNRPDDDAARQRDRFLAAFAHELRTPLTVAQGWADLLLDEDVRDTPMGQRASVSLHDALGRLADRTRDVELLAVAALGRLEPRRCDTTVAALLDGLDVAPEVGGDGPDVLLHADPDHLGRVLRDLWGAAWLSPTPAQVRLDAHVLDLWVELAVVRVGDPIEPAVLQALFDPFDLNDDATGVTIGLYLARALTVAHGGTLGVEQDDLGARLWVRVPRRRPSTP